jgi:hypothetical protein
MLRRLLNIASIVCLVLCAALMGLWVRSYRTGDVLHGHLDAPRVFKVTSLRGTLTFVEFPAWSGDYKTTWGINRPDDEKRIPIIYDKGAYETTMGFGIKQASVRPGSSNILIVSLPHWFLVMVPATLIAALKTRPVWRFTLLELLIVTTCVSIVLGMFAWIDRAWIGK